MSTPVTDRPDTRSALLAAAGALLREGGAAALTLRAIGARAGVSRQAPYLHFPSKDALLAALAADGFDQLSAEVDAAREGTEVPLEAMSAAYVRFAFEDPHRYRLMFGSDAEGRRASIVAEKARELGARFVAAFEVGSPQSLIDPLGAATVLYAASHGAVDLVLGEEPKETALTPMGVIRTVLALLGAR